MAEKQRSRFWSQRCHSHCHFWNIGFVIYGVTCSLESQIFQQLRCIAGLSAWSGDEIFIIIENFAEKLAKNAIKKPHPNIIWKIWGAFYLPSPRKISVESLAFCCLGTVIHTTGSQLDVYPMYIRGCCVMILEKRQPRGGRFGGVNSPLCARGTVRYGAKFHRFSYSSSNFSMVTAMLCGEDYQEIAVRLIHNSAIARLSANSSCVSHYGQRQCQTFLLQFHLLLWWVSVATDPETYYWCSGLDGVVDFRKQNCNISFNQKPIIWFPELLFKFINGLNTILWPSELIVNLRWSGESLACDLRERNCCQSEIWFDCIVYNLHIFL